MITKKKENPRNLRGLHSDPLAADPHLDGPDIRKFLFDSINESFGPLAAVCFKRRGSTSRSYRKLDLNQDELRERYCRAGFHADYSISQIEIDSTYNFLFSFYFRQLYRIA